MFNALRLRLTFYTTGDPIDRSKAGTNETAITTAVIYRFNTIAKGILSAF